MWKLLRRLSLALILLLIFITAAYAQQSRTLTAGTPVEATLNAQNLTQVFTYTAAEAQTVTITAINEDGVSLAVVVNDVDGAAIAQGAGTEGTGELILESVELAGAGTYFITVLNAAGVTSDPVDFSLVVDVLPSGETTEPTVVPEATTAGEPAATAVPPSQLVTTTGLQVELAWNSIDDLDLEVRDPVGGSLYWRTPTVDSGGTLSANANQGCIAPTSPAQETASWPSGGIPTGSYEVLVYYQQSCTDDAPASLTVTTTVDGESLTPVQATLQTGDVYVFGFTVNPDGTFSLNNNGGIVVETALPDSAPEIFASAQSIGVGETVTGSITNAQPYQAFTFEAESNLLYSISLDATSGSLDTFLEVLDSTGAVVRFNDDLGEGFTNSSLSNILLPSAGTYTIVATRYGKDLGATEGNFELTLTSSDIDLPDNFASNIQPGSLQMLLLWNTNADLQLLVRDPAGDAVFDDVPQIRSGGRLAASGNVNCTVAEGAPYSYIYWPAEIPPRPGSYEVEVWYQNDCGDTTPVTFNLYISAGGQPLANYTESPLPDERFLTSFEIAADGTAIPGEGGIIRGVDDLDYLSEIENAQPILVNQPVTGSITSENEFDLFVFQGSAGDVVNIAMNNTAGSLDPLLYLIAPSGTLVASNDDAVAGENTNSLIANFTLPEDGQYIIIATHFGGLYGGTTGTYQLSYSQLN
jgi:uncharacterized protein YfaP (DUF2135 family)